MQEYSKICIFTQKNCEDDHDKCRSCNEVPVMNSKAGFNTDTLLEDRILCAIAGRRNKNKEEYGSYSHAGMPFKKLPAWFEKIINNKHYEFPCYDHVRYYSKDSIILEPYNVSMNEIYELINICKENNLSFCVDGNSAHFPAKTFRIVIKKLKTKSSKK